MNTGLTNLNSEGYSVERLFFNWAVAAHERWGRSKNGMLSTSAVWYCFTTKGECQAVLVNNEA
jgi:hypothetical protein